MNKTEQFSCITSTSEEQKNTGTEKLAGISSKFSHLIWQNNDNYHDKSKLFSVHSYNGIAS